MANMSMTLLFLSTLMATQIHPLGAVLWKCVTGSHCFLAMNEESTSRNSAKSRCVQMGGMLARKELKEAIRSDSDFADSVAGPCYWVDFFVSDPWLSSGDAVTPIGTGFNGWMNLIYAFIGSTTECTMMCDKTGNDGKAVVYTSCFKSLPYICQRVDVSVPKKPAGTQPATTSVPKKPADTQPGEPTDPPVSTTPSSKKPAPTRPKRHGASKTVFKLTTAGLIAGSPLSIRMFSMPTMCSRLCQATGGCKMFNYHMGSGECRAFAFKTQAREPGDGQWGVWELTNG